MANERLIETYLARAQELEEHVRRIEQNPPDIQMSPRWRDVEFLRREAARWRSIAASHAGRTESPSMQEFVVRLDPANA